MPKESAYFTVTNINGKHDVKQILKDLDKLPGVISVSVNLQNNHIAVDFDNTGVTHNQIENNLNKMGFSITETSGETHIM